MFKYYISENGSVIDIRETEYNLKLEKGEFYVCGFETYIITSVNRAVVFDRMVGYKFKEIFSVTVAKLPSSKIPNFISLYQEQEL